MRRLSAALISVSLVACSGGASTPTGPGATALTATVTVTDAVTGAPIAGVTVVTAPLQAQPSSASGVMTISVERRSDSPETATLNAAGYLPRSFALKVPGAAAAVTMIPASFNVSAFDEMARVSRLQRWIAAPPLRVLTRTMRFASVQQSSGVAIDDVMTTSERDRLESDLTSGLPILTGNRYTAFASVTREQAAVDASTDILRDAVITVARYTGLTEATGFVGYARWQLRSDGAVLAGTIMLDRDFDAAGSPQVRLVRIHELGHALGYTHVTATTASVMNATAVEPTDFDRQATRIAFQRPPGNQRPDADPTSVSLNSLSAGVWSRGEGLPLRALQLHGTETVERVAGQIGQRAHHDVRR